MRLSLNVDGSQQIYVKYYIFLIEDLVQRNNIKGGFLPSKGSRYLMFHVLMLSCVLVHGYVDHMIYLLLMINA